MKLTLQNLPCYKELVMYNIKMDAIYLILIWEFDKLFVKCYLETYDNDHLKDKIEYMRTYDLLNTKKNIFLGAL